MSLYHIYNTVHHDDIVRDGLRGVDWPHRCTEWELPLSPYEARGITLPDNADDRLEVGRAIAEYIFEDERPQTLPSRANTVFFYADKEYVQKRLTDSFNAVIIDPDHIDAPLVYGNDEWKTHVMQRTMACVQDNGVHLTEDHLRNAARRYWSKVETWPPADDGQSVRIEVFGPTNVSPSAIAGVLCESEYDTVSET